MVRVNTVYRAVLRRVVVHLLTLIIAVEAIDHARKVELLRKIRRTVGTDRIVIVQVSRIDLLRKEAILPETRIYACPERIDLIRRHDHARRIRCAQRIANGIQVIYLAAKRSGIVGVSKNTHARIRITRDTVLQICRLFRVDAGLL